MITDFIKTDYFDKELDKETKRRNGKHSKFWNWYYDFIWDLKYDCVHFSLPTWLIKFLYRRGTNFFIFPSDIVNKHNDINEIMEETEERFF